MIQYIKVFIAERPKAKRVIKFGIVGISCVFLDFIVVFCLFELMGIDKFVANGISSVITVISNYLLNRVWTFRSKNRWQKEFLKFITFASIGAVMSNIIVQVSTKFLSSLIVIICKNKINVLKWICIYPEKFGFYSAKILAIGIVFFWNFFVNNRFNFKNS